MSADQPVSLIPATFTPSSLFSRLSPPEVRWEESSSNEDAGPTAESAYVETPTAPNSPEPTAATLTNTSSSNVQQPPLPAATPTHLTPACVADVFLDIASSSVRQPQIPMAFPPSQDTDSTSVNLDNIMGWTTGPEPAAPPSWASLAAQVPTTSWWGSQTYQQPADDPSMAVDGQPSNTPTSNLTTLADADMGMDAETASPDSATSSPWDAQQPQHQPAFQQPASSSNNLNGTQYSQPDAQQNSFSSDQQTTWTSAPQMPPNFRICCQDNVTGAWLTYVDPRLQICVFDPSSQTYIPLQPSMQPTYVGTNPMGNQTQSFSGSIHTSFDPYQQYSPGPEQQSSSSSTYISSYPLKQYVPSIQQQRPVNSMPISATVFPSSWNQPLVDPTVAATLVAYDSWGSTTGIIRSQDPPVATFDATPAPPRSSWYQSEVDRSVVAFQAAYISGESISEFGYQDPALPNANIFPLPEAPVSPRENPEVEVVSEKKLWGVAIQHSAEEDDLRRGPSPLSTETARRLGVHPPAIRLRRLKYRKNEPSRVNGVLFDAQACKQHRINECSRGRKVDPASLKLPPLLVSLRSQKKRPRDESEYTTWRRTLGMDADGSKPIRPFAPDAITRLC